MAEEKGVVLLDFWVSPFGQRVRIALNEKGVEYEYKEEYKENNIADKSPLLLKSNPVHKRVPVLLHDGRSVCESLVIVEYIDEVWPAAAPLLPSDPYARAQARFWADLVDQKVVYSGSKVWQLVKGAEQDPAAKDLVQALKLLEGELGNKAYFGGDNLGFVDVSLVPFTSWFHVFETFGNFVVEEECPKLVAWARRCLERESVSKSLQDPAKVYEYVCSLRKRHGIE